MLHKVFTSVRPRYPLEVQEGSIMNVDTKRFLQTQMMWIAISLVISLSLSFLLPFPLSLVTMIGVFLVMSYYMRRWQMRRMGMMGGGTSAGGGFGSLFGGGSGGGGVSYVCMVCGQRFKSGTCPRCGSKMKRAGF
jgi:uncharacterized membrane protein YgcG